MVDVETEFTQSLDFGLTVSAVGEEVEVEVVGGRAVEIMVEEVVMGPSCETVMTSLELGGDKV